MAPNAAFLTVAKVADGDANFPFTVDGAIVGDVVTTASFSLSGGETRDAIAVSTSSTINVAEGDVAGWELDSVVCVNDDNPAETDGDGLDIPMTPGQRWTCTFTNVPAFQPPDIVVVKSADPTSVEEPGGSVTFTVQVINNGGPGTIDSLVDDVHGDLVTSCRDDGDVALVGQSIDSGQTLTCTFSAEVNGNAGESEIDTVTAVVLNDAGSDSAYDSATVTISNVPSAIEIVKTANPTNVDEPGGDVTFSFVVNNLSAVDTVTIDTLKDSIYGDLNGQGDCSVPQTIAAGGSYSCCFTAFVDGMRR